MSDCELIRTPSSTYFGGHDSPEKLSADQEMIKSDSVKENWQAIEPTVLTDQHQVHQKLEVQERPKTFRCRQCTFLAVAKEEFWEHMRIHIKAEKLLTCPKCPFVTEFKHHLEYHLRNHYGSKPFKCDQCSYTCVNNSMLKSHLKSHSNVYQYRCASCDYATKYLHSLKIHLRRFSHEPAMVLNPDGTPNPLPVVDIYGTRRGPKQKPAKIREDTQQEMQLQLQNMMGMFYSSMMVSQMMMAGQTSPIGNPMGMDLMNPIGRVNGVNGNPFVNVLSASSGNQFFPISSLVNNEAMEKALKLKASLDYMMTSNVDKTPKEMYSNNILPTENSVQDNYISGYKEVIKVPVIKRYHNIAQYEDNRSDENDAPLDLRKSNSHIQEKIIVAESPKAAGSSKRKGQAIKLEDRVMNDESDDEQV